MTNLDTRVVRWLGVAFFSMAAALLFRQLELPATWLVVGVAATALGATVRSARGEVPWLFPAGLAITTALSVLTWLATKDATQLIGVAACVGAVTILAARTHQLWAVSPGGPFSEKGRLPALVTWLTLGFGASALAGAIYFHALTLNVDSEARRLVLSFSWVALSMGLLLFSRMKRHLAARDAGFAVLALSLSKILFYDSTHLDGFLRIAVFGIAGVMLFMFGSVRPREQVRA